MKTNIKVEFPCGYKYEITCEYGAFDMGYVNEELPKECPIHLKECPPKRIIKKEE